MLYGIAILPPNEIQQDANSYRKRFDPYYKAIQPHITVREKEDWTEEQLQAASLHLQHVTETQAPFQVNFNRFSSYYPVNNVIYMAFKETQPLVDLHDEVCTGPLEDSGKPYNYHPHLTVGQKMGADELHDVLASLKNTPVDYSFTVDALHVLGRQENGEWTVIRSFPFKG
ncbi:2'-5' RNA ligase family protein [Paenibacillus sp. FJAT-26967]|uniref:2'-5' RNA ligase family protein n=1 Tax=Paenibacillus sp. FJAT-26967 TaxID=1729690 RepID=UPI0008397696|nr:2'-5' RNA ligase family protein [Paenibacillus sp. FJAT-26967]